MKEQNVYYNDIGNVLFLKSSKARSIRITVHRQKGVRVTVPRLVSMRRAHEFVELKRDWIRKNIEHFSKSSINQTIYKPGKEYSTRYHYMQFSEITDKPLMVKVTKGCIQVYYPSIELLEEARSQALIRKSIEFALRKEAKHYFPLRVEILAKKHGFTYNSLRFKNLKSRWGSCSAQNNINLNIHLMRLPEYLSDYVILHELVHTIHKNHGKFFWKKLDEVAGDARKLAREMRQYQTQVF